MNAIRRFIVVFLILVISLSIWGLAQAQTDVMYFPESGHYIKGAFLQYYNAAKDPLRVYGYPITEQITAKDGNTVQYFNKARFELTSDNRVILTPLGRIMYQEQNPLPINSVNGCQQYQSGFSVCLDFLKFYKEYGENRQFGNPISSFEFARNGLIVQHFEGARFEWDPNRTASEWVVVADLGSLYFKDQNEDPAHLQAAPPPDATIKPIVPIKAHAFVLKAVTLKSGEQNIYVLAKNEKTSQPLINANITAVAHLSNGANQNLTPFITNQAGIGQTTFSFSDQKPGELITIDITVNYEGYSTTTTTSFRIWF